MRVLKWLVCFVTLSVSTAHAAPSFTRQEFAQRRQKLLAQISDGIAILLGAEDPESDLRFRQNNTFYYFTGVEMPNSVAILEGETKRSVLYVPERTAESIAADAKVVPGPEGQARTGMDAVFSRDMLDAALTRALGRPEVRSVYLVLAPEEGAATSRDQAGMVQRKRLADPWDGRLNRAQNLARIIRDRFPHLVIKDLTPAVDELRWVKSPAEIAVMRECGRIGTDGIRDAIAATKPGLFEYVLEGVATGTYIREGAQGIAFQAVAASGENTVELHYSANNAKMKAGDVVLLDFAPDLNYYVTDITRTWPVSGRFTDEQLKIYECLLDAHKQTIAAVKPGVRIMDLVRICRSVFEKHGFGRNMLGGIGHFVGMSVHDPGFYNRPFVPGVVFNVEPLFMDRAKKLHMRLEDTIVVTANGHENLTAGVPMEAAEIYKLMETNTADSSKPTSSASPVKASSPSR